MTAEMVLAMTGNALPLKENKGSNRGKCRCLILNKEALGILNQSAEGKSGLLFPGQAGQRLSSQAIGTRMRTVCRKAGVKAVAYGYRHGFATSALANGVPDATVAALLGHSGTTMLHKHYSHLCHQAGVMREALKQFRG